MNRVALIAVAAMTIGGSVGCSSGPVAKRDPGTLASGTAKLTVDGADLPTTHAVNCAPAEESLTTIKTGDGNSGATFMVSNAGKLVVEFVRIRNLNGFTGDYNRGLGGSDATVSLTESTYQISGAALGYGKNSPEPTTTPFTIKVSC